MLIWEYTKTGYEYKLFGGKFKEFQYFLNCKTLTTISLNITIPYSKVEDLAKVIETSHVSNFECLLQQSKKFMEVIPVALRQYLHPFQVLISLVKRKRLERFISLLKKEIVFFLF